MANGSEERILVYVVGTAYDGRQKILRKLCKKYTLGEDMEATLARERDNEHDKYAVGVLINGKNVGYVPKKVSKLISKALKRKDIKEVELNDIHLDHRMIYGASITITF